MNGLTRNTAKLFSHDGKLFILALDHAQAGVMEGLTDVKSIMRRCADSALDGFLVNTEPARAMAGDALLQKKLLLRSSFGGTRLSSSFSATHKNPVSPMTALSLGADAVVMMLTFGEGDAAGVQQAASDIDAFHQLGIPVVAEILAIDFAKTQTYETQANGARVAAELGADVIKAFYTERFDTVVANCPVPLILAGGPKETDIFDMAKAAVDDGVKGFAFGRNLFMAEDIESRIQRLDEILHT
jgi:class I fructose-bisphosphate aldolase/fructose-bisphosphate aldolase/2-amino-3,7-dideoxy-D-threo-hept-6-ulosonate synthase